MKRDNTPWRPVEAASLQWDDAANPISTRFDDYYYSSADGIEESRYVFLQGNDLPRRWLQDRSNNFCIAETGFGSGLNFLLTWQAWRELPQPRPRLHYLSVEKFPLARDDIKRALAPWSTLAALADEFLAQYPGLVPGQHRLQLEGGALTLDLWWEDVTQALPDLASQGLPMVDAWYLDGFTPARNAAMWQPSVLHAVAQLSRTGATFSTFTAASEVRRELSQAGFTVDKAPGFGLKRECLRGTLTQPNIAPPAVAITPWDIPTIPPKPPTQALVIGGGLAGCHAAYALARRGIAVTLLEQGQLASAGSGNEQGILYTRLSRKHSALTDFALQSFCYASRLYRQMFQTGTLTEGRDGSLCGSFHQNDNSDEMAALAGVLDPVAELAQVLDIAAANARLGIEQNSAGYWFPSSGWLSPAAVCRALTSHPGVTVMENCGAIELCTSNPGWNAMRDGKILAQASCAVIATGTSVTHMSGLDWLPVQLIRGQTTQLPQSAPLRELRAALCHEGYIAPASAGQHCIGATFVLHDEDSALRDDEHTYNLSRLAAAVPALRETLANLDVSQLQGRVGYRCASPDYLPLAGRVPDRDAFLHNYAQLRKNARQVIDCKGEFKSGLYLSSGHGSRGLTSTPLAAEVLASQICGEPIPLSRELQRALAPARFLLRDLARNRI